MNVAPNVRLFFVSVLVVALSASIAMAAAHKKAPDFTLRDLDGKKIKLGDLEGEGPILISLWALWCRPCLEEMPHIDELYQKYEDQGLRVSRTTLQTNSTGR